jgi:hypothetical protein
MNNNKICQRAFSYQIKTIISNSGIMDINFNKKLKIIHFRCSEEKVESKELNDLVFFIEDFFDNSVNIF